MAKRRPAVAGAFYAANEEALRRQIRECFLSPIGPGREPSGITLELAPPVLISPHAGYMYSGPVASHGYLEVSARRRPSLIIVVGPNHYGIGSDVSVYSGEAWITPLGEAKVNKEFARELAERFDVFSFDEFSHDAEHSLEVQVPFLQYIYGQIEFVPICMLDQSMDTAIRVGEALAESVTEPEKTLLVTTTDFTHYEPHDEAVRRDMPVIEKLLEMDVEGFYLEKERRGATLCGYGPVAVAVVYASKKGYRNAKLLKYATSGDVTGDKSAVVAYASITYYAD